MSDNRATRAHIAASRGYLHEYLSTDALLTDEIADALMHDVAGKSEQFDTGESHGPLTALQALRADGGSAVDEHAARLAFAARAIAASPRLAVGDRVLHTGDPTATPGTVTGADRDGMIRVRWDDGVSFVYFADLLRRA